MAQGKGREKARKKVERWQFRKKRLGSQSDKCKYKQKSFSVPVLSVCDRQVKDWKKRKKVFKLPQGVTCSKRKFFSKSTESFLWNKVRSQVSPQAGLKSSSSG